MPTRRPAAAESSSRAEGGDRSAGELGGGQRRANARGFPDAGGFPALAAVRSRTPLSLVRDLIFRVRVKGTDVPPDAGKIEVGLAAPGKVSTADPYGTVVPPTASSSTPVPPGPSTGGGSTFVCRRTNGFARDERWIRKDGPVLPATVAVSIRYQAASGRLEIDRAELTAAEPSSPNLLPNGGFEAVDAAGQPVGWQPAEKYTYFPPGRYYMFNSWHNEGFANRGRPALDALVVHAGHRSLRMPALAGDELAVSSAPIALEQKEARLIEASVWIKTDRVNEIQVDAVTNRASGSTASTSSTSLRCRSAPTNGASSGRCSARARR